MRQLAQKRKERLQMERELEEAAELEKARVKKEEGKKSKKVGRKRSFEEMQVDGEKEVNAQLKKVEEEKINAEKEMKERRESLPSVGAHGVARQDGVGVHEGMYSSLHLDLVWSPAQPVKNEPMPLTGSAILIPGAFVVCLRQTSPTTKNSTVDRFVQTCLCKSS